MKLNVLGVKLISGTSKASGNPFVMCRLVAAVSIEKVDSAKVQIKGFGFEVAEMEMEPSCLEQFSGVKFPADLELLTDQRAYQGEFKTFVTGLASGDKVRKLG